MQWGRIFAKERGTYFVQLVALTRTGSWHVKNKSPTELRRASSDRQPMELLRRPAMARYVMAPAVRL